MFKVAEINGEVHVVKYISPDENYGVTNLVEIDILSRLEHPNIIHAVNVIKIDKKIAMALPLINFKLDRAILTYSTEEKLKLIFQLIHGLEFIHDNNISHLGISKFNIGLKDDHPYFINCESCILSDENKSTDVYDFGKLCLEILGNKDLKEENLFKFVHKEYRSTCISFVTWILQEKPTSKEILNHEIFNKVRVDIKIGTINCAIDCEYSPDHRDIIKLIVHWCRELFPEKDVKLLFLAVDLFNRTVSNYNDTAALDRMALGASCLLISSKIFGEKITIIDELKVVNILVQGITKQMIIGKELEIIDFSEGVLNISLLYNCCNNGDEIKICFDEIIMNKDAKLYANLDVKEWIKMINVTNPTCSKEIKIKDL